MRFFLISSVVFYLIRSEFFEDLKKITDFFECDPKCTFNHSEINSKSIELFPNCNEICGILILNSNLDLSEPELSHIFSPIKTLYGGMIIENTQISSLNFLRFDNFFCEKYGFLIRNNPQLTDISVLENLYLWGDQDYNSCDFRVENNEKLVMEKFYNGAFITHYLDIRNSGNFKDYGCRGDEISESNIHNYENCEILFGGLKLLNTPESLDLNFLSKIQKIIGPIDIQNTSIEDLSFLKSLNFVQIDNIGLEEKSTVNIQNNPKMTKLGFPLASHVQFGYSWTGNRIFNFENLHPDFCLTIEEMSVLSYFKFTNIHVKFCTETGNLNGVKFCKFEKMSSLEENCFFVFGDILMESGDEKYASKFNNVMQIFGSLTVQGTHLKRLDFFPFLTYISSLNPDQPAIRIVDNKNLQKAFLPAAQNIVSRSGIRIIMENNHPKLFNSSESDLLLPPPYARDLYTSMEYKTPPF